MNIDKKSREKSGHNSEERIDLNNYNQKEEQDALKDHTDASIKSVDRNLNEQMGGTGNTVTGEPNHT